ncbi:MAG: hypothetical protein FIA99_08400 [Ruminiclostridium sp.]|nr:hypothetical protein [Ruminiclostridium sp.]
MNITKWMSSKFIRQGLKNAIITCYSSAGLCAIGASSFQSQFNNYGYIKIKKAVTLSAQDANRNIRFYRIAAAISFSMAVMFQIILKLLASTDAQKDDLSKYISTDVLSDEIPQFMICPKCSIPLWGKDNPTMICSNCQSPLEDVNGFYDRHPELRHSEKETSPDKTVS